MLEPPRSSRYAFFKAYLRLLDEIERPPIWLTASLLDRADAAMKHVYEDWRATLRARTVADELHALAGLRAAGFADALLRNPRRPEVEQLVQAGAYARLSARYHHAEMTADASARSRKIAPSTTAFVGVTVGHCASEGQSENQSFLAAMDFLNEGAAARGTSEGLDRDTIRREFRKFQATAKVGGGYYLREAFAIHHRLVSLEAQARANPLNGRKKGLDLFRALARRTDPSKLFLERFILPDPFDTPLRASA